MIHRLRKITDGIYRGSAPSPDDVKQLHDNLGIKKIVSLDYASGKAISRVCKLLGIKHIMVPIDSDHLKATLLNLFKHNLKDLLEKDGPTFVHCRAGKDRTGFVSALFKCKYLGTDPEEALEEAKSLGFGINCDPKMIKTFEKLIRACKPAKDKNEADIVSNEREYKSDFRDGFLDTHHDGSFAPYLSKTRQYPMDAVYNYIVDQSPTRENYPAYKSIKEHDHRDNVPLVGVFDNNAGIRGFGPVDNAGGFIYE